MFSFFKKKEAAVVIPSWAPFEDQKDYVAFRKAVINYFKDKEVNINFDGGSISVPDLALFGINVVYLSNLAKYCLNSSPERDYATTVESFFSAMEKGKNQSPVSTSLEAIKLDLGLRILPDYIFKNMADSAFIGFPIAKDLFCFLVFDLADTVVNVKRAEVSALALSDEDLMDIGKRNIEKKYPQEIKLENILDINLWMVTNEFFYAPNLLLNIEQFPDMIGSYGSLIGLSNGQRLFIYPIEGLEVTDLLAKLTKLCMYFYENEPNPISSNLYWYNAGKYELIPYNMEQPDFSLLPESFLVMLRSLMSS